jgi:hypothetical protein
LLPFATEEEYKQFADCAFSKMTFQWKMPMLGFFGVKIYPKLPSVHIRIYKESFGEESARQGLCFERAKSGQENVR